MVDLREMASLFDVDVNESLGIAGTESEPDVEFSVVAKDNQIKSFDEKVEDIKVIMTPAPTQTKTNVDAKTEDTKLITKVLAETKTQAEIASPAVDYEEESDLAGVDFSDEVDADIAAFAKATKVEDVENSNVENSNVENTPEVKTVVEENDNPLELTDIDLKAYHQIKQKFPQFLLYNGSRAFRDFYRYKVIMLRTLLSRFKILNFQEMVAEVRTAKIDQYVGTDEVSIDLLRKRLDESYIYRTRISSLMVDAYEQMFAWERWVEMLRAKLWKDHEEIKSKDRRDGLSIEHMYDVEQYVQDMLGFVEVAKQVDGMLKSAAESLSRQLTCIQLKQQMGMQIPPDKTKAATRHQHLDDISEGAVISVAKEEMFVKSVTPKVVALGASAKGDDLSELG